jgi:hypothetical protein
MMVIVIGVGLAGLTHPSVLWSSLLFSAVMLVLLSAIVGLLLSRGRLRAFWISFAVFGWGYWLMSSAPWIAQPFRQLLISDRILLSMYPIVIDLPMGVVMTDGMLVGDRKKLSSIDVFNSSQLTFRQFKDIGHYWTNLVLALAGGYFAWLAVSRQSEEREELTSSPEGRM